MTVIFQEHPQLIPNTCHTHQLTFSILTESCISSLKCSAYSFEVSMKSIVEILSHTVLLKFWHPPPPVILPMSRNTQCCFSPRKCHMCKERTELTVHKNQDQSPTATLLRGLFPILLCCPTTTETDISGGMDVDVELSISIIHCCFCVFVFCFVF